MGKNTAARYNPKGTTYGIYTGIEMNKL